MSEKIKAAEAEVRAARKEIESEAWRLFMMVTDMGEATQEDFVTMGVLLKRVELAKSRLAMALVEDFQ